MSTHDELDLRMVLQAVEDGIDLGAWDPEDDADAGIVETVDDDRCY